MREAIVFTPDPGPVWPAPGARISGAGDKYSGSPLSFVFPVAFFLDDGEPEYLSRFKVHHLGL